MIRLSVSSLVVILLFATTPAYGQARDQVAYLDMDEIESWFDDEPSIEVNIRGALLGLVAEASRFEDPELAETLLGLRGIQIRGFDVRSARSDVPDLVRRLGRRLESSGWETVARVRDKDNGEQVHMYLYLRDGAVDGVIVFAIDDDEEDAIFVSISGRIDPAQVGRIGRRFDVTLFDN